MYLVTDSARTVAGLLPLLVRPPGTVPPDPVRYRNTTKTAFRRLLKTFLLAQY